MNCENLEQNLSKSTLTPGLSRFIRPALTSAVVWAVTYGLYIGSLAGNNLAWKSNIEIAAIFNLAMAMSRYNVIAALALAYTIGVFYQAKKRQFNREAAWSIFGLGVFCLLTLAIFLAVVMPLGACLCSEWLSWDHHRSH